MPFRVPGRSGVRSGQAVLAFLVTPLWEERGPILSGTFAAGLAWGWGGIWDRPCGVRGLG